MRTWMLAIAAALVSTNVWSQEDESFTNYDSIVSELKASEREIVPAQPTSDIDWEDVAIHGAVGLGTSMVSVATPEGNAASGFLKGFQIGFGINLFTRKARAEGAFTNYSDERLSSNMRAELKEFELRLVYLPVINDKSVLRVGGGVSARYMDITVNGEGNRQASTPSSVFLLGFERKLNKNVAVGPDLSYRSALISDTFDRSAWDATLRLNATF